MNKDQIKGRVENLKGRARQAAGTAVGDHETEAKGAAERIKGAVRAKVGDAKQSIARASKKNQHQTEKETETETENEDGRPTRDN